MKLKFPQFSGHLQGLERGSRQEVFYERKAPAV